MDTTVAPFNNADVRNALKWAINREEILKKVFLGHGIVGNDNPIAPSVKFAYDPKPKYTYDPEKAKALLKKAGMANLKVDLSVADAAFNGAVDAAVLYQQSAKAAGHRHQRRARAQRRLLRQRLAEEAVVCGLLERTADRRLDVHRGLRQGCGLERDQVGQSQVQRPPGRRRAARPTRRSGRPCIRRCSSSCTTTAARS